MTVTAAKYPDYEAILDWSVHTPKQQRFLLSFNCHYGPQSVILDNIQDVAPSMAHWMDKFRDFRFTDWSLEDLSCKPMKLPFDAQQILKVQAEKG